MKRAHNRAMWICVVTTLAAQGVAQAQEKQNFRARDCYAGSVELMPKNIKGDIGLYDPNIPNYFVGTYHMVGTRTLLEGPDFLKNLSTECLGFNIYKDKRVDFGKGACTYLTGDGSLYVTDQSRVSASEEIHWTIAHASGSLQKLRGKGIYTDLDAYPPFEQNHYQYCLTVVGEIWFESE